MNYTYIINPSKLNAVLRQKRERIMKTKTLFIDEEVQGEKIVNLNTEQLIKQVVKNIDDSVISVEIKKRHKSDDNEENSIESNHQCSL